MVELMSNLALQSGTTVGGEAPLVASNHGNNADAHHSHTSDGLDITPTSVTIQGSSTTLTDGNLDLGANSDDALSAAMVQTLTGGGDADSLHTHAASSGGGACYTVWGITSCGAGHTQIYAGNVWMSGEMRSPGYPYINSAAAPLCIEDSQISTNTTYQSYSSIYAKGNQYTTSLECALCCQ